MKDDSTEKAVEEGTSANSIVVDSFILSFLCHRQVSSVALAELSFDEAQLVLKFS